MSIETKLRKRRRKSRRRERDKCPQCMDKNASEKEVCDDLTRESLIAISYDLPEKDIERNPSPKKVTHGTQPDAVNGDEAEKYRSELISISYSESPDVKDVPAQPV